MTWLSDWCAVVLDCTAQLYDMSLCTASRGTMIPLEEVRSVLVGGRSRMAPLQAGLTAERVGTRGLCERSVSLQDRMNEWGRDADVPESHMLNSQQRSGYCKAHALVCVAYQLVNI